MFKKGGVVIDFRALELDMSFSAIDLQFGPFVDKNIA